jgi:HEAT repeats
MSNRALNIAREYLRSSDAQVKKNAATALAAIGSHDSIETLVRVALADGNPEVRARAEEEIRGLPPEGIAQAQAILEDLLSDGETARDSFALLGRLRLAGIISAVEKKRRSRERLRLAAGLGQPARGFWRNLRWSVLPASVYATLLSIALFSAYLQLSLKRTTIIYIPILFVLPLALLATRGLSPFGLYYDRGAGLLVETGKALYGALKACVLVGIVFLAIEFSDGKPDIERVVSVFWVCGTSVLFVGAVRCGTLLAWGLFRTRFANRNAQAVVGATAGSLALTLLLSIGHTWLPVESHGIFDTAWVYFIPTSLGLAWVFAKIDGEAAVSTPVLGRGAWILTGCLLLVVAIPFTLTLLPARKYDRVKRALKLEAPPNKSLYEIISVSLYEKTQVAIKATFNQRVVTWLPEQISSSADLQTLPKDTRARVLQSRRPGKKVVPMLIALCQTGHPEPISLGEDSSALVKNVQPGSYFLLFLPRPALSSETTLVTEAVSSELLHTLSAKLASFSLPMLTGGRTQPGRIAIEPVVAGAPEPADDDFDSTLQMVMYSDSLKNICQ